MFTYKTYENYFSCIKYSIFYNEDERNATAKIYKFFLRYKDLNFFATISFLWMGTFKSEIIHKNVSFLTFQTLNR